MSPHRQCIDHFLWKQYWTHGPGGHWIDVGGAKERGTWRRQGQWVVVDRVDAPEVTLIADMRSIPLPTGSASIIKCTEAFYFLSDPRPALREFRRLLNRSGVLVATAPWMHGVSDPRGDQARFSATYWENALATAGFTHVTLEAFGGYTMLGAQVLYDALVACAEPGASTLCRILGAWARRIDGDGNGWALGWGIVAR